MLADGEVGPHASEVLLACCARGLGELLRERTAHLGEKMIERRAEIVCERCYCDTGVPQMGPIWGTAP